MQNPIETRRIEDYQEFVATWFPTLVEESAQLLALSRKLGMVGIIPGTDEVDSKVYESPKHRSSWRLRLAGKMVGVLARVERYGRADQENIIDKNGNIIDPLRKRMRLGLWILAWDGKTSTNNVYDTLCSMSSVINSGFEQTKPKVTETCG